MISLSELMDPRLLIGPVNQTCAGTTRISASAAATIVVAKRTMRGNMLSVLSYERDGSQANATHETRIAMLEDSVLVCPA